jgi:uncharacterized SAM-binding protein YcdF (DUF218 family)
MFFYLKKFLSTFAEPLTICFILFGIGLYHLYRKEPNLKKGRKFITIGLIVLFLFSWSPFSHLLISPFESKFQAYKEVQPNDQFDYIFVLGSGFALNETLPATSQLGEQALARVVEGVRLHKLFPDSKLIFSGYGGAEKTPYSVIAANAAIELGINPDQIIQIPEAKDTIDESTMGFKIVGDKPFLLISSAAHLPRSIGLFKKLGMNPTPAPADFINKGEWRLSYPSSGGLYRSERAIYEGLGTTWAWLTGRL